MGADIIDVGPSYNKPSKVAAKAPKPLHGDWVHSLKIGREGDSRLVRTLFKRRYALEFEIRDRVKTQTHTDYPGVNVIDLFDAQPAAGDTYEPESLDSAIARNPHYQRFLLSFAGSGLAVITSRIGYPRSGKVAVLPASYGFQGLDTQFDMYDRNEKTTDGELTQYHIGRLAVLGGDPTTPAPQNLVDDTFRYMVNRSPERR